MVGRRVARAFLQAAACCLLLAGAACRTAAPAGGADSLQAAQERGMRSRGIDPATVIVPWQLDTEMRAWAHRAVPDNLPVEDRLERLMGALLGSNGLGLEYATGVTGTARDVFTTHRANCLAFTSLFVGMARELGVSVFYLDVGDVEKFEREGNLVVESGHVTAGFDSGGLLRILEFTPLGKPNYRQLHRVSDLTAIALYYSNRGAELLRAGQEREALDWLRKSVAIDPELARGWINLGVALRRTGDPAGSEAAYRKALEADPGAVAAYQDLAALMFASGRSHEGDELMALSGKLDIRNPFNFLSLGDLALAHGRTEEARGFYRRAQRVEVTATEAEAALGQAALAAGDRREARRRLRKAVARDSGNERVRRLAVQLGEPLPRQAPSGAATRGAERQKPPGSDGATAGASHALPANGLVPASNAGPTAQPAPPGAPGAGTPQPASAAGTPQPASAVPGAPAAGAASEPLRAPAASPPPPRGPAA
jgi:Flp pilus assembly protein TadD